MTRVRPLVLARKFAPLALPAIAILLACLMTFTGWAAANATIAALLFAWIVMDALCCAAIANAPHKRPALQAMLGAATLGSLIVLLGASPAIRERILEMTSLLTALGLTAALWLIVAGRRIIHARRSGAGLETAFAAVLPGPLLRFVLFELRMAHLALFVWRAPPDVPARAQGFAYHRYLAPMLAVLIGLQVIELGVVHLLLSLWSPLLAWIVFALTLAGLLRCIAFAKSLRLMPVLIDGKTLRVRCGAMTDLTIPLNAIAAFEEAIDAPTLDARSTLNTAFLSAPNVTLRLAHPVAMPGLLSVRMIERVALRLDEPAAFQDALRPAMTR